eukprot:13603173-Alexandrium_andersonii.AAC.1
MVGLDRPIPVALQAADYLSSNSEASLNDDGSPVDLEADYPRVALYSVTLRVIHNLGQAPKAIVGDAGQTRSRRGPPPTLSWRPSAPRRTWPAERSAAGAPSSRMSA